MSTVKKFFLTYLSLITLNPGTPETQNHAPIQRMGADARKRACGPPNGPTQRSRAKNTSQPATNYPAPLRGEKKVQKTSNVLKGYLAGGIRLPGYGENPLKRILAYRPGSYRQSRGMPRPSAMPPGQRMPKPPALAGRGGMLYRKLHRSVNPVLQNKAS